MAKSNGHSSALGLVDPSAAPDLCGRPPLLGTFYLLGFPDTTSPWLLRLLLASNLFALECEGSVLESLSSPLNILS